MVAVAVMAAAVRAVGMPAAVHPVATQAHLRTAILLPRAVMAAPVAMVAQRPTEVLLAMVATVPRAATRDQILTMDLLILRLAMVVQVVLAAVRQIQELAVLVAKVLTAARRMLTRMTVLRTQPVAQAVMGELAERQMVAEMMAVPVAMRVQAETAAQKARPQMQQEAMVVPVEAAVAVAAPSTARSMAARQRSIPVMRRLIRPHRPAVTRRASIRHLLPGRPMLNSKISSSRPRRHRRPRRPVK